MQRIASTLIIRGSTRQITEQELSNSINQLNPANPSTYRLSNPNPAFETKKIEDSGLYIDEGEENLGYFFVTLASTFEAKKAIYLIKNNFDIMTEWHHSDLKVELKNKYSFSNIAPPTWTGILNTSRGLERHSLFGIS